MNMRGAAMETGTDGGFGRRMSARAVRCLTTGGELPRRRTVSGAARATAVAAVLAAGLAVSGPAQAQTATTLVSNTSETGNAASTDFQAQSFRTGGVSGGYTITEIGIRLTIPAPSNTATPRVVLREDNGGEPGDLVATFTNPASFSTLALNTFTAPANTTVEANTTYWVSINEGITSSGQRLLVSLTESDNQTGAAGWSIGDNRSHRSSETDSWSTSVSTSVRMQIKGHNANAPYVANAIPDRTTNGAGAAFSYTFSPTAFEDPNGDALTYTATQGDGTALPSWLTFTAASRTFAGTPPETGTLTVKVTASDGTYSVSDEFNIRTAFVSDPTPTSPPELVSVRFRERARGGTTLDLVYNEGFNVLADVRPDRFSISVNGGTPSAPAGTNLFVNVLTMEFTSELSSGDTVTVSYTPPTGTSALQDYSGNHLGAFTRTFNAPHEWWRSGFLAKQLDGHCHRGGGTAVGWSSFPSTGGTSVMPCHQGLVGRDLLPRDIELGGRRYTTDAIYVQASTAGGRLTVQYARSLQPALEAQSLGLRVDNRTFWFSDATQGEGGRRYTWDDTGLSWSAGDRISFSYRASSLQNEPPAYTRTTHLNCDILESRAWPGARPCDWRVPAIDPEGETLTYSVDEGDEWADELFRVDSEAQVRVRDGVYLDYETAPRKTTRHRRSHHYWLKVRATDPGGLSDTRIVGISVLDWGLEPESGSVLSGGTAVEVRMPFDLYGMRLRGRHFSLPTDPSIFDVVVDGTSHEVGRFEVDRIGRPRGAGAYRTFELREISPAIQPGQDVQLRYRPAYGPGGTHRLVTRAGTDVPFFNLVVGNPGRSMNIDPDPVTLRIPDFPPGHDGSTHVAFELVFSEAPGDATQARIKALVEATNATVHAARRVEAGNDRRWTVELAPSAAAAIVVSIPATEDCTEANAICSEAGGMLEEGTAFQIPYATPIVATFDDLPEAHGGNTDVTFTIDFAPEPADLDADTVKANLTVTDGTLGTVSRETEGSNARWSVTVTPSPGDDLVIALAETTDCEAANAICTGFGGKLETVPSPATIPYQAGFSGQGEIVPAEPVVATFHGVPETHDGSTAVSFEIAFAPEPATLTGDTVKENLTAYNGTVGAVTRVTAGSNARWRASVTPEAGNNLRIVLNPTVGCAFPNAICTAAGGRVEASTEAGIDYAAPLTVAYTEGHEPPAEHDGRTAFKFRISFSEDPVKAFRIVIPKSRLR